MATSSSAKKVAKLASRGKGSKVRFQGGTTFPAVVAIVSVVMLLLIGYAKASMPGIETGPPQPGDEWSIAYAIRVCDETLPNLTGTAEQLGLDASTGNMTTVQTGSDADGIIHYHPQEGGNTGRKARLGVFLDIYDVTLTDTVLELPESQVGPGETRRWDTEEFKCDGKDTQIRVRVWDDYASDSFVDNVTNFDNIRFTNNGMAMTIAVVPKDADIPKPESATKLADLGVISGSTGSTVPSGDTVPSNDTTPANDTTPTADTTGATTTVAASTTTGG